jgi:hypothetical protein
MSFNQAALRQLARELRYRPLPALGGRKVPVTSFDTVESRLRALLLEQGLVPSVFNENNFRAAISKYDLIDVSFETPTSALDHPDIQKGIPVLRELGFLEVHERQDLDATTIGDDCLDMLAEDIDSRSCDIKLFLVAEAPRDLEDSTVLGQMIRKELPNDSTFPESYFWL